MPYKDPVKLLACKKRWRERNKHKTAEFQRQYHKKHKDRIVKRRRRYRYGLSPEECDALSAQQNDLCAICGLHASKNRHEKLCVDHDHATGKVRGMLCFDCNFAIGLLKDNPSLLLSAIAYLEKFLP